MNTTNKVFLALIIVLALGIRTWKLDSNPAGFFCDEASIGYNAYSLLNHGKDEYGIRWPIFYRAFGEYKSPIMLYSTIPSIFLFGLSEFSVRFVSAIYGTLGIVGIYFLAKNLFSPTVGLLSALFLAISPWSVHLSRVSLEGLMPFVFFTTLATSSWYRYSQKRARRNFYLAIFFFALALYSYFPARIFIPLFTVGLALASIKQLLKDRQGLFLGTIFTLALIFPLLLHTFKGPGMARWHQVSSNQPLNLNQKVKLYLAHFSPTFLFQKGDIDFPGQFITRHSVRGLGELYLFQLPLIIIGLIYLFISKKRKTSAILLSWLLFYPLGSSLTNVSSPQATRSIIGVVPFQIISAAGIVFLLNILKKTKKIVRFPLYLAAIFIFVFSFFNFIEAWRIYPVYSSDFWGWQYGPKEIMKHFLLVKDQYDDLYMGGEFNAGEIFLKFYDPKNTCQGKCKLGDFYRNPQIYNSSRRQIFSLSPKYLESSNFKSKFSIEKTIYYPSGKIAFLIGEVLPLAKKGQNDKIAP